MNHPVPAPNPYPLDSGFALENRIPLKNRILLDERNIEKKLTCGNPPSTYPGRARLGGLEKLLAVVALETLHARNELK